MRRILVALPVAALALTAVPVQSGAQTLQKSRGTIANLAADSITVKVGTAELKFSVDAKTVVEAPGGSTKTRQAAAAGKPGPKLADLLKVGDAVEVSFNPAGDRRAESIRKIPSAGSAGVPGHVAFGTVTAVSPTSLSIKGSGGGGSTFTQTFVLDGKTNVSAKGASTALASSGGKGPAPTIIHVGDRVSVSYEAAGSVLHASEVRVTLQAAAKQ